MEHAEPEEFRLIGTSQPRLDTPAKVDGSAEFGMDVRRPGMLFASVERCPVFGGRLARLDGAKAEASPGVRAVVPLEAGVAVVADSTWQAFQARERLEIEWDPGPGAKVDSAAIRSAFREQADAGGAALAAGRGEPEAALAGADKTLEIIEDGDHRLSRDEDLARLIAVLSKVRDAVDGG